MSACSASRVGSGACGVARACVPPGLQIEVERIGDDADHHWSAAQQHAVARHRLRQRQQVPRRL
jgi:hypothetical protein